MIRVCRFCNQQFKARDLKYHEEVCPSCIKSFLQVMLKDEDILKQVATAIFSVDMNVVGLGGAGSIAEFFCEEGDT